MEILIKIKPTSDPDIWAIRSYYGRGFIREVRKCLSEYAEGRYGVFHVPDVFPDTGPPSTTKYKAINLHLKKGRDDSVICFLSGIKPNRRTTLIKSLIRHSYSRFPVEVFLTDGEAVPAIPLNEAKDASSPVKQQGEGKAGGPDTPLPNPMQHKKEQGKATHVNSKKEEPFSGQPAPGQAVENKTGKEENHSAFDLFSKLVF